MSLLSRLFGGGKGGDAPTPSSEQYNGFVITPDPIKEGPHWRVAARIEKDGQAHRLIRADTLESRDAAAEASVAKAKLMIDQQGDRIFG